MRYYYDFHIHSALSPCAEDEMTPCNIVGMAKLIGLDVIAVTDHNTCGNVQSVIAASKATDGALIIPGMELETEEAIHVLMLFPSLSAAIECQKRVQATTFKIKNKPKIYGNQLYLDSNDNIIKTEEHLLVVSSGISLEDARLMAIELNGVAIPAHIDKPSNALIAILGAISPDMGFGTVELSPRASSILQQQLTLDNYMVLHNSDAHMLEKINEKDSNYLELDNLSAESVIMALANINFTPSNN